MAHHIAQADGQGQIDVNGHTSPVSYHLTATSTGEKADETVAVSIELSLPRDWLLEKGFQSEAVLIRANGEKTPVRSDSEIGVDAPISVMLKSSDADTSERELARAFPELAET